MPAGQTWWRQFLKWDSLFPGESRLCQADKHCLKATWINSKRTVTSGEAAQFLNWHTIKQT